MRILARCSLIIAAAFAFGTPAGAEKGPPWCAAYRNGSTNCGFYTYQQCMETIAGNGGFCNRNYIDGAPDKPDARKERKARDAEPKAKRKEKEEVKERVAPAPKPEPPPVTAQPVPAIVQPPPAPPAAPVAVQPPSEQQLMNNFQTARALILSGKYQAGLSAMKALGYDDHPDVADSIGFANAKLGNLAEARIWYSKALAADPNHVRTWSDSGALYLVQGDLAKARGDLEHIKAICGGTTCREYQELDGLIAAKSR